MSSLLQLESALNLRVAVISVSVLKCQHSNNAILTRTLTDAFEKL